MCARIIEQDIEAATPVGLVVRQRLHHLQSRRMTTHQALRDERRHASLRLRETQRAPAATRLDPGGGTVAVEEFPPQDNPASFSRNKRDGTPTRGSPAGEDKYAQSGSSYARLAQIQTEESSLMVELTRLVCSDRCRNRRKREQRRARR
jgi:hypothetical protein